MGKVLALPAARGSDRPVPDPREMRAVGLRRFAECLADVIQRHAPAMSPNDRREADEALRGLVAALEEAERRGCLHAPDCA
ncbi:hypothetical protein ACLBYG_22045 [Methylobacterium sp. D53M]